MAVMLDKSIEDLQRWFTTADSLESIKFVADATKKAKGTSPLCFVVDDEPGICHFICATLDDLGIDTETFGDVPRLVEGLSRRNPDLIFLDISLDRSDAVDAIRGLRARNFRGLVQLISGHGQALLDDIKLVGEERSLRMLPGLSKPFSGGAIRKIISEQKLDAVESADQRINLADALRQGWVEFWYQPKIDLRGQRLVGVEALARVHCPNGAVLAPGQFLPQADEASLMTLTEGAVSAAMRDGISFAEAGFSLQVAVNVPASALLKLPIPAIVREYHSESTPRPDLVLEVTEDQIIDNLSYAFEVATQLKIYGIKLSLDDFGHGYSSLARLKALPFAELKIDRSFVADCDSDKANFALCTTIIDLAHRFDGVAVAEGIESAPELLALQRMGCDQGQGYLFARPMPKDLFLTLLRSRAGFGTATDARALTTRDS
jgi:EAL domain-containing protein (putative c-di-GMP-specific phosphodiesterase class I)/FixJ family two-component response regulator